MQIAVQCERKVRCMVEGENQSWSTVVNIAICTLEHELVFEENESQYEAIYFSCHGESLLTWKPKRKISFELFTSKKKLNLFIASTESIYLSHCGWIATDNSPVFVLLVQDLECCLLACISALLFVFSTRVDESTDWQSDYTLDDSAKPWLGLAVQLFTERAKERKKERKGSVCFMCVSKRKEMNDRVRKRE